MPRELWDAYDREGNLLGFDLVRGEAPRDGIYHLVVEIYSVTRDGRILVTQRALSKPWGGCWEVTGGSVLKGESPLMGAVRELREETGIVAGPEALREVCVTLRQYPGGYPTIQHTFLAFFDPAEQKIRLQEGETVDWRLLPYEEFQKFILRDEFVDGIRDRFLAHQERFDQLLQDHIERE